jgi:predicted RNA-binding Zn ribbon-like protein
VGRRRTFLGVDAMPLVGGSLCLDLANTTGARASEEPRERLMRYADVLVWATRSGVLTETEARRLGVASRQRPQDAGRAIHRLRRVREEIHQTFAAIAAGAEPPHDTITALGHRWRAARSRQELVAEEGRYTLRLVADGDDLDRVLWPVIASTIELLTSDRRALVKQCAECDWLFIDDSKNGSRRWCKGTCGSRARARTRYARDRRAKSSTAQR